MRYRSLTPPVALLRERLIVVAGLLVFFALALGASLDKSLTIDEPAHITRGIVLSQTGDLSLQVGHTPLSHRLIGLLMPTERELPDVRDLAAWPSRDRLAIAGELLHHGVDVDRLLFLARLPIIWSGLLLGATVALWTAAAVRRGENSGKTTVTLAVVMALFASSPNLLASAALATTDMVSTVTYFAAICAWWYYWRRPNRSRLLATGILLGLALSAKLTGILLVPLLLPLAYVYGRERRWWRPALVWLGVLAVAALSLWAVYAFQFRPVPLASYWQSWRDVLGHVSDGHRAFFLGELSSTGWLLYFPVTLLIKTPLPVLLLFAAGLAGLWRAREWRIAAFLLLPVAALLAAAVYSSLNIGYRHILPAVPFMLVTIGMGIPALWSRRAGRWAASVAVVWALAAALWLHPHHLAYFNELVGGPAQGYRYLGDSNLDWGQDLKGLAGYAATLDGDLAVSYGGAADPAYYGLDQPSLAGPDGTGRPDFHPANPSPGHYAISAGHIQGLLPEADLYDWFRRREPDGSLGYSILLYDVAEAQPGEWIAQCASPVPLLSAAEAERLVGLSGARGLTFDCESNWVFPNDGAPGWYILPRRDEPWWIAGVLQAEPPVAVYRHGANEFGPDYEVYYWPGTADPAGLLGTPPAGPLLSGGPSELRGYQPGATAWHTFWHVTTTTTEPLSVQGHLYAGEGPPQVADGLGFSTDQWRPGDWFIQRHVFASPGESLETGLYNYLTLEPATDQVRLPAP